MRKKAAMLDDGLEIRRGATPPPLQWPETGGTLAHWRYSRVSHRPGQLPAARLRYASPREVMDAVEDLLV